MKRRKRPGSATGPAIASTGSTSFIAPANTKSSASSVCTIHSVIVRAFAFGAVVVEVIVPSPLMDGRTVPAEIDVARGGTNRRLNGCAWAHTTLLRGDRPLVDPS